MRVRHADEALARCEELIDPHSRKKIGNKVVFMIAVLFISSVLFFFFFIRKDFDKKNGKLFGCLPEYQYKVMPDYLPIRSSKGVSSNNFLIEVPKNTNLCRLGSAETHRQKDGRIANWGKVQYGSYVGWVNLCKIQPQASGEVYKCDRKN